MNRSGWWMSHRQDPSTGTLFRRIKMNQFTLLVLILA